MSKELRTLSLGYLIEDELTELKDIPKLVSSIQDQVLNSYEVKRHRLFKVNKPEMFKTDSVLIYNLIVLSDVTEDSDNLWASMSERIQQIIVEYLENLHIKFVKI